MSVADCQKIELHLHLEGAAPPHFIRRLADEKNINLQGVFDPAGHYIFRNFVQFLRVYEAATTVLQSPEDFYRLTAEVLSQSASQGVIYTEFFLSPEFCGGGDLAAWTDYLAAIEQAAIEAQAKTGIRSRGMVTCIRHFGPDLAQKAASCAAETAGDYIVGFGMAGDELQGKQGEYSYSFDMAREAQLKLTTHAGEWGGAESVRQAVRDLNVARIGHGVQVIEDPELVAEIAAREIVLEICPGSNVALGVFPSLAKHPIQKLRDAGVLITVSTDDPPFFHTDMKQEYTNLAETFGWGAKDFLALNITAVQAAFCDIETKQILLKALESA